MGMGKSAVFDIYKKNMRNFVGFLAFLFLVNLGFIVWGGERVSAAFVPTLSASVDRSEASLNGRSMLLYTNGLSESRFNFRVRRNLKSGYVATLSTETDETALMNETAGGSTKISSIVNAKKLNDFTENSWGYKVVGDDKYDSIPGVSTPKTLISTSSYGWSDEAKEIQVGIKIGNNLDSGKYSNKLVFSVVSNSYELRTIMAKGRDFNERIADLDTHQQYYGSYRYKDFVHHIKRSESAPEESVQTKDISADDSDYPILAWYKPAENTVYFYSTEQKIFLNKDCSYMFVRFKNLTNIDFIREFDMTQVVYMSDMFSYMENIESLDLSFFDTKNVVDMSGMFSNSAKLSSINLSNFKTSNVTDMSRMFYGLSKITNLNISMFDTSNVINMSGMFSDMGSLTNLNISSFDTSNVTNMREMFYYVSKLTNLDLSHFNTAKVTGYGMIAMFCGMNELKSLNVTSFDTSKITNMYNMFHGTYSLTELDLSSFDTSSAESVSSMFLIYASDADKDKLEKIYVSNDFNVSKITEYSNVFGGRKKLRGGNGSYLEDPGSADLTWLRVDRPGVQGYFTRKP